MSLSRPHEPLSRYKKKKKKAEEDEPIVLSPAQRRRRLLIHIGTWFLVAVFALTSGIMCVNISGPQGQQGQQTEEMLDPVKRLEAEVKMWEEQVGRNPQDALARANLGFYLMLLARARGQQAALPTPEGSPASPAASPASPQASPASPPASPAPSPPASRPSPDAQTLARASQELEQAIKLDPDLLFAYQRLADVRFFQGRPAEARQLLATVLEKAEQPVPQGQDPVTWQASRNSARVEAYLSLAQMDLEEKKYRSAIDQAGKALELDPGQINGYRIRAEAWQALGDKDRARADLLAASDIALKTQNQQVWLEILGEIYQMDGKLPPMPGVIPQTGLSPAASPAAASPPAAGTSPAAAPASPAPSPPAPGTSPAAGTSPTAPAASPAQGSSPVTPAASP